MTSSRLRTPVVVVASLLGPAAALALAAWAFSTCFMACTPADSAAAGRMLRGAVAALVGVPVLAGVVLRSARAAGAAAAGEVAVVAVGVLAVQLLTL